jgi:hypothetical protein
MAKSSLLVAGGDDLEERMANQASFLDNDDDDDEDLRPDSDEGEDYVN